MDELNKTNRLTVTVVAIVLVIIVGLITYQRPDVSYVLTPAESLALLNDTTLLTTPNQAQALLNDSSGKIVFIDLRNSVSFEAGHIKRAVNIPIRELFSKESKSSFKEFEKAGKTMILYGETQQQANGPWLMLHQTGLKNVKLFTGNFAQLDLAHADSLTKLLPQLSETALIDTAALKSVSQPLAKTAADASGAQNLKKTVTTVKKTASSGGGC